MKVISELNEEAESSIYLIKNKTNHGDNKEKNTGFRCKTCPNNYETKRKLGNHSITHIKKTCPHCNKIFIKKNLLNHLRICSTTSKSSKVKGRKKLICDICDYKAPSKIRLGIHLGTHMKKEKILSIHHCSFCEYVSNHRRNLKRHEMTCNSKSETVILF